MKTTSELAAQIVGSKNSVEEFKAEHARVKGILDARMSESRTSKTTSELARETARKLDADDVLTFDDQVATIKSTLDAQATQYREVLKVATDALKWCAPKCEHCNEMAIYKEPWTEGDYLCAEHGGVVTDPDMKNPITHPAFRALARIAELTPKV